MTCDGAERVNFTTMNAQQLDELISAAGAAQKLLFADAAKRSDEGCKTEDYSIASPITPNSGSKSKTRGRSPACADTTSIIDCESPAQSKCRTDFYQSEALAALDLVSPTNAPTAAGYGKACLPLARAATPYDTVPRIGVPTTPPQLFRKALSTGTFS